MQKQSKDAGWRRAVPSQGTAFTNEHLSTIQVVDAAITVEGRWRKGEGGLHLCYLEKVGDVLVFQTHGLGAAEGGIGCHMDPLLLAPLNSPVIAPMAMHFHLHIYCCTLTTLLCCCTVKSAVKSAYTGTSISADSQLCFDCIVWQLTYKVDQPDMQLGATHAYC